MLEQYIGNNLFYKKNKKKIHIILIKKNRVFIFSLWIMPNKKNCRKIKNYIFLLYIEFNK